MAYALGEHSLAFCLSQLQDLQRSLNDNCMGGVYATEGQEASGNLMKVAMGPFTPFNRLTRLSLFS